LTCSNCLIKPRPKGTCDWIILFVVNYHSTIEKFYPNSA
jgi:hypothetical protein